MSLCCWTCQDYICNGVSNEARKAHILCIIISEITDKAEPVERPLGKNLLRKCQITIPAKPPVLSHKLLTAKTVQLIRESVEVKEASSS